MTRLYRTLVRVVSRKEGWIAVSVPGWNPREQEIFISLAAFKPEDREKFEQDYRCHAKVNLDVDNKYDLVFEEWELP